MRARAPTAVHRLRSSLYVPPQEVELHFQPNLAYEDIHAISAKLLALAESPWPAMIDGQGIRSDREHAVPTRL